MLRDQFLLATGWCGAGGDSTTAFLHTAADSHFVREPAGQTCWSRLLPEVSGDHPAEGSIKLVQAQEVIGVYTGPGAADLEVHFLRGILTKPDILLE
jgi:hypothetical protein